MAQARKNDRGRGKVKKSAGADTRKRGSSAAGKSNASPSTPRRRSPKLPAVVITPEQRRQMIAEAAYYQAEKRGFSGGNPAEDWLAAEREVDRQLAETAR
ncbi:MAG TPA: DUF2934 domain-containing protein [Gammaproteobacteria bacterium]|nr:DUF2934 domain-containing protein [Gammaproteobacteria bacterium]